MTHVLLPHLASACRRNQLVGMSEGKAWRVSDP